MGDYVEAEAQDLLAASMEGRCDGDGPADVAEVTANE